MVVSARLTACGKGIAKVCPSSTWRTDGGGISPELSWLPPLGSTLLMPTPTLLAPA
jgi:hypothetical protein